MNRFYSEIMNLKEAEDFKRVIKRWHILSENMRTGPSVKVFSAKNFAIGVIGGKRTCPFSVVEEGRKAGADKEQNENADIANDSAFQVAIARKLYELFGSDSDKP